VKAIAAAVAIAVGAWLVEESADSVGPIAELAVLAVGPLLAALIGASLVQRRRIAIAILLALIAFGAAYGGKECFARAYNGCVGSADDIKGSLDHYRRRNGRYPAKLTDAMPKPPCRRCLRGTILRYTSSGPHYTLSFSDSLVSWETTDASSWRVAK
jgi:hypothetical protein